MLNQAQSQTCFTYFYSTMVDNEISATIICFTSLYRNLNAFNTVVEDNWYYRSMAIPWTLGVLFNHSRVPLRKLHKLSGFYTETCKLSILFCTQNDWIKNSNWISIFKNLERRTNWNLKNDELQCQCSTPNAWSIEKNCISKINI